MGFAAQRIRFYDRCYKTTGTVIVTYAMRLGLKCWMQLAGEFGELDQSTLSPSFKCGRRLMFSKQKIEGFVCILPVSLASAINAKSPKKGQLFCVCSLLLKICEVLTAKGSKKSECHVPEMK